MYWITGIPRRADMSAAEPARHSGADPGWARRVLDEQRLAEPVKPVKVWKGTAKVRP